MKFKVGDELYSHFSGNSILILAVEYEIYTYKFINVSNGYKCLNAARAYASHVDSTFKLITKLHKAMK